MGEGRRSTTRHAIVRRQPAGTAPPDRQRLDLEFLGEEPLLIQINERPYLVVMRTPGEERAQAVGFCLGEGILDTLDDLRSVGYDEHQDPNVIDIWLRPGRATQVADILGQQRFVSQTSCGICGKRLIEDLHQDLPPAPDGFAVSATRVRRCLDQLDERQQYYLSTRASHAACLFDEQTALIAFAEDVGRHNALDKAIGHALLSGRLLDARLVVLSSRNSFELIQKTARARIPILVSKSRPTALAVALGKSLEMTLAFPDKADLVVVCGEHRITDA